MRPVRRFTTALLLILWLAAFAAAQQGLPPLPQDTGAAGLQQAIQHLRNTGRLLQTTAHPDDEDGGMLTLMSRGLGAHVTLLTLNRGEGGQNRTGSGLFDELGVLRTLELTASDRYYGVEQRFTRVVDFGYSKTAAETFEKWGGHDVALGDMVRIIRTFRPDVIVSRFQGTSADGHGNHEASGILTKEAFRAAGDPKRFPDQIEEGLLPWQAKKLYIGTGFRENPDYTVILETTQDSAALGMNYQQFAMQGLKHQISQGAGQYTLPSGKRFTRYKLIDSVLPNTLDASGHERDFFDGIDTSVAGLSKRLGADAHRSERLTGMFRELQAKLDAAAESSKSDPRGAARPLAEADAIIGQINTEIGRLGMSKVVRDDLSAHLPKSSDIEHAIDLAEGVTMEAKAATPAAPSAELVVPGQQFEVAVDLRGPSGVKIRKASIVVPEGWNVTDSPADEKSPLERRFTVHVSPTAQYTKPYFHRDNADTDTIYKIDNRADFGLPLVPPPVSAQVDYEVDGVSGRVTEPVKADSVLEGGTRAVPIAVAPEASVLFEEPSRVVRTGQTQPIEVTVRVRSNVAEIRDGQLSLITGSAWRVEPLTQPVDIQGKSTERTYKFFLFPNSDRELRFDIRAKLTLNGRDYFQGFSTVTRPDLATSYYYQPAVERVSVVRLQLPQNYVVGYIMGAGDDIPTVLRQAGLNVKMIAAQELVSSDLSKYNSIVVGIRAYDVNEDVKKYNDRLLSFVEKGGTLVVQYNAGGSEFSSGHYTPYPVDIGRDRVSVEQAPVEILDPKDLVFNDPNDITQADFDGWVQERGLYFAKSWGGKFVPLLRSNDPGEPPLDGGLIRASYGKGTYIYTGYAFFRQLPYGVPGALRLFVNLLSAHQ
jgi:LmbE family N-acetylglucosaminyl deacetylase